MIMEGKKHTQKMKNKNKLSKGYNLLYSKHYQEYIQVLQCEKTAIRRTIPLKTLPHLLYLHALRKL